MAYLNQISNSIFLVIGLFFLNSCSLKNNIEAEILNRKGLLLMNQGAIAEAKGFFTKAIQIENVPAIKRSVYFRNIAICYTQTGSSDSARIYYEKAVLMSPADSYEYYVNMADIHLIDHETDKAVKCLEKAININSNDLLVNNSIGLLYLGEYDTAYYDPRTALNYNMKAYQISPNRNTKFVLAKNYYEVNDYTQSGYLFDALHKEFPNDVDVLICLIIVTRKDGLVDKESQLLDELKKLNMDVYTKFKEELYYIN